MYVGVLCVILGQALLYSSILALLYSVAVFFVFHLFIVKYEEPKLLRTFEEPYKMYCEKVPRWMGRLDRRIK